MAHTRDILAAVLGVVLATGLAADEPVTALFGPWVLDAEHSDDPAAKTREAMAGMRGRDMGGPGGRGGGVGGPGGGMGGPGGGMGGPGGGQGGSRGRGGMGGRGGPGFDREESGRLTEPPLDGEAPPTAEGEAPRPRGPRGPIPSPTFVIEQSEGALVFSTERGSRLLRADGEKRKKDGPGGRAREVVARWRDGGLEVKTSGGRGATQERYRVREDGRLQIDFETTGQGPMPAVRFKLVYARPAVTPAAAR